MAHTVIMGWLDTMQTVETYICWFFRADLQPRISGVFFARENPVRIQKSIEGVARKNIRTDI